MLHQPTGRLMKPLMIY